MHKWEYDDNKINIYSNNDGIKQCEMGKVNGM